MMFHSVCFAKVKYDDPDSAVAQKGGHRMRRRFGNQPPRPSRAFARIASSDHIAAAFARLAELTAEDAISTWQRDFGAPWVRQWLSVLATKTERQLYRTVADIGKALIADDRAHYGREAFHFEVLPQ